MKRLLNIISLGNNYLVNTSEEEELSLLAITISDAKVQEINLVYSTDKAKKIKVNGDTIYPLTVLDVIKDLTKDLDSGTNENYGKTLREILNLFILKNGNLEINGTLTLQDLIVGNTTLNESKIQEINNFDPSLCKGEKGDKGDQGILGNTGPKGDKGDRGESFKFEDFTEEQLESLKGPKGDLGPSGLDKVSSDFSFNNDGALTLKKTNNAELDNTLPITSAGVHTILGNIEVLLNTI